MFQVVAVIEEESRVVAEFYQDPDALTGHQQYRILPAFIHIALVHDTAPFKDLKLFSVQVNGMDRIDKCLRDWKELFICLLDYDLIRNKPSLQKSSFNFQAHIEAGQAGISVNF
jgi:hypothetical protein